MIPIPFFIKVTDLFLCILQNIGDCLSLVICHASSDTRHSLQLLHVYPPTFRANFAGVFLFPLSKLHKRFVFKVLVVAFAFKIFIQFF